MSNTESKIKLLMKLSCDEQYTIAKRLAANTGYKLVPEDSVQEAEDRADLRTRLDRLEAAVLELNPGLRL